MSADNPDVGLGEQALAMLACHECRGHQELGADGIRRCRTCGTKLSVMDGVVVARDLASHSYFDKTFEVMRQGNREKGTWELFYRQQTEYVSTNIHDGEVVVDVGCGPELPYWKGKAFVIGVDASFESIRANATADLRVFASAAKLPLKNACVDAVMCFYSIHHMTGRTVGENHAIVRQVFHEFRRILKRGGRLLVFDVSPRWPFGAIENLTWNAARRAIGASLDMYFWQRGDLERLGAETLDGADLRIQPFSGSRFTTFPPVFSVPGLRVPRILYPFHICLYEWRMAGAAA